MPRLGRVKGIAVLVALLALVAASASEAKRQPVTVRVLTRNLYLGANLDPILQAKSFHEAFLAVEADWAQVQANDFPTRARAIAREIAQTRPDFVGFQELTLYRTQTPADLTVTPATTVALDYAAELRKALAARKLHYRFVGIGSATDAELPSGDPPTMDIRLTRPRRACSYGSTRRSRSGACAPVCTPRRRRSLPDWSRRSEAGCSPMQPSAAGRSA